MSLPGWIKIHRALMDHWSASEPEALAVWIRMLCEANFEEKTTLIHGQLVTVKRGQLVFGLEKFSARSGVSIKKLRRIVDMLVSDGMLGRQVMQRFSIITITCYDKYQDMGKQEASTGQAEGKRRATPKEDNKSISEEGKKDKSDSAGAEVDFSPLCMTDEQIAEVKRIRKKTKGGALTQRVINGLAVEFEAAANIGWGPEDILNEWELRGWKSFKAEWIKPKGGSFDGMSAISRKNAQNLAGEW